MTREQTLEEALHQIAMKAFRQTDIGENHAAGLMGIGDRHTFLAIRDMANEARSTPPDADTRAVTTDMLRGWLDGFKAALDTAKSITVSVGAVSQADVVGILQDSFDRQCASISDAPRIIDTRVVSVNFLETVGEILRIDLSPEYFAIRAIIEGKDQ